MRMLGWISGNAVRDRIEIVCICRELEAVPIKGTIRENGLR